MTEKIARSFSLLKWYVENEDFKGWDPYDGLNSRVFQNLPIKRIRLARLAWIQLFKRSPVCRLSTTLKLNRVVATTDSNEIGSDLPICTAFRNALTSSR